ncbi:hypothetical protein V6U90_25150 [Micromonospora sp. CPCC 206060]|uniref:hypothetical protein n=1 Tax=Micromonospora sp. CPCC 206060 TaxID=3122406 RepID=UPI002FF25339
MSENHRPAVTANGAEGQSPTADHPAGALWAQSTVAFGIRAAALASLAVPVGLVAGGFLGAGGDVQQVAMTTCCPTLTL